MARGGAKWRHLYPQMYPAPCGAGCQSHFLLSMMPLRLTRLPQQMRHQECEMCTRNAPSRDVPGSRDGSESPPHSTFRECLRSRHGPPWRYAASLSCKYRIYRPSGSSTPCGNSGSLPKDGSPSKSGLGCTGKRYPPTIRGSSVPSGNLPRGGYTSSGTYTPGESSLSVPGREFLPPSGYSEQESTFASSVLFPASFPNASRPR